MPNRIIRESCRTSPTLMLLTDGAERLFWRLTTVADDFGRFEADPDVVRAQCFPRAKEMTFRVKTIAAWFEELRACCLVTTYVVSGHRLGFFTTWDRHQRRRAQAAKYPAPTPDNICQHPSAHVAEESRNRGIEESRHEEAVPAVPAVVGLAPDVSSLNGHVNEARALLDFLNVKAGRSFRPVPATLRLISARLKEGASVQECRGVIARMVREWNREPKEPGEKDMRPYLRPETLFNATKFESYRGQQEPEP